MKTQQSEHPKWLVFVDKAPDDEPWLRMMVLNPLNGAMSTFINRPIDADPCVFHSAPAPLMTAREN